MHPPVERQYPAGGAHDQDLEHPWAVLAAKVICRSCLKVCELEPQAASVGHNRGDSGLLPPSRPRVRRRERRHRAAPRCSEEAGWSCGVVADGAFDDWRSKNEERRVPSAGVVEHHLGISNSSLGRRIYG